MYSICLVISSSFSLIADGQNLVRRWNKHVFFQKNMDFGSVPCPFFSLAAADRGQTAEAKPRPRLLHHILQSKNQQRHLDFLISEVLKTDSDYYWSRKGRCAPVRFAVFSSWKDLLCILHIIKGPQGFAVHTSHHQRATIGHNRPKYAKMGHTGLNKQKKQKKQKQTKKKQRFLETVGIGGMSLFFFVFLVS